MHQYISLTDCCNITNLKEKGHIDNFNCVYKLNFEDEKYKLKTVDIFYEALKPVYEMFLNFDESIIKFNRIRLEDEGDEPTYLYISIEENLDRVITLRFKSEIDNIKLFNEKFIISYEGFINIIKDMEYIINYNK